MKCREMKLFCFDFVGEKVAEEDKSHIVLECFCKIHALNMFSFPSIIFILIFILSGAFTKYNLDMFL